VVDLGRVSPLDGPTGARAMVTELDPETGAANALFIESEIAWFATVLDRRMRAHAGEPGMNGALVDRFPPPRIPSARAQLGKVPYVQVVRDLEMSPEERLVMMLAYLPHIRPAALDPFFIQNRALDRRFTEFGGLIGLAHGGFLPTAETAMFMLAGDRVDERLRYGYLFHHDHFFYRDNVLRLDHRHDEEPSLSAALQLTPEFLERLSTGKSYEPPFSALFPAKHITTRYEWDDLVLDPDTRDEVEDVVAWAKYRTLLLEDWGLSTRLNPGYRCLFHGPPGTGKTLTACLLGKRTGLPVYRIDLARVVSKYIGETEKNLASLFNHAEHQDWILFFDEADALFGKRTESRNANDRAANQQIAYLLQRIEDYPGIAILATNLRANLDEAFARRFQSSVHFQMPDKKQRARLWRDNFADKRYRLDSDIDLDRLARDHELAGGAIVNVLRYACLKAAARDPQVIRPADLNVGIRRELQKTGKSMGVI